jgi:hypothetical protein
MKAEERLSGTLLSMPINERPIQPSAYERIHALISAYGANLNGGEEAPLGEILHEHHAGYLSHSIPVPLDDLSREKGVAREEHHARLVLESLMRGKETVPVQAGDPPQTVCGTPGCPNLTHGALCWHCELEQGEKLALLAHEHATALGSSCPVSRWHEQRGVGAPTSIAAIPPAMAPAWGEPARLL